jgi:hypothetical protein
MPTNPKNPKEQDRPIRRDDQAQDPLHQRDMQRQPQRGPGQQQPGRKNDDTAGGRDMKERRQHRDNE